MDTKAARKVSDYIKDPPPFYPNSPQDDVKSLVNVPIKLIDSVVRKDVSGNFGRGDVTLLAYQFPGDDFVRTTITSHEVLARKINKLKEKRAYPVDGKIITRPSKNPERSEYFDLVDSDYEYVPNTEEAE